MPRKVPRNGAAGCTNRASKLSYGYISRGSPAPGLNRGNSTSDCVEVASRDINTSTSGDLPSLMVSLGP